MSTIVTIHNTSSGTRVSRGRGAGLVAFLFGMTGRSELSGAALRRMLGDLGLSDDAARSLLAKMVRHGQLSSQPQGRTTTYALAGSFARGFARVRDQTMTSPLAWPGHFHALLHSVPEEHRAYRDQLRRTAVLAGFGTLQPGVLIAPTDRRHALEPLLATAPNGARTRLVTLGMTTSEAADAASAAWDLEGLAQTYRQHIERLTAPVVAEGPGALRAYVDVFQPALTDTLREPALDPALLPSAWPGPALREAFGRFETAAAPVRQRYLRDVFGTQLEVGAAISA